MARRLRAVLLASSALCMAPFLAVLPAAAQDATWELNPSVAGPAASTFDFNADANWSGPATVPTGTAFFGVSNGASLSFSLPTTVGGWTFNVGASAYSFDNIQILAFTGAGIVINGGSAAIANSNNLYFYSSATADSANITNNNNDNLYFFDSSTAGNATVTNSGGSLRFYNTSTAASAAIVNDPGGTVYFLDTSTAGSASITNNAILYFLNTSTAGSATIVNDAGGTVYFNSASTAGSATITNNGLQEFYNTATAGSAAITNSGTLNFYDTATAGSATFTNSNGLNFNNASTAGNATIANNSGGVLSFNNTSTAGSAAITNNAGGTLSFNNTSTAASATITNNNSLNFNDTSTAGSATITNNSTVSFNNTSTASNATINSAGSYVNFGDTSTAAHATITATAGEVDFRQNSTAGNATITNNGISYVVFTDTSTAGSATIAGNTMFQSNSTAGSATIASGTGNIIFEMNTTAGSATITNDGNLYFQDSGGAGSAVITNNGSAALYGFSTAGSATITNNNASTTIYNDFATAGSATITNNAGSATTFKDSSTAGSATITNGGSLIFQDTSEAGSAAIANNSTLTFNGTGTAGSATITNNASGTTTFNNTSTAGGATIINASGGQLYFKDTATAGTAAITNSSFGFYFQNTATAGSATITNNGGASLNFADTSTAGSATITNNGNLVFNDSGTAGNASLTSHANVTLNTNSTLGSANFTNTGTVAFNNSSTAGSATITNSGTLDFADNSTAGNAAIANTGFGTVDFSFSTGPAGDNKVSAGSIAGTGNYSIGGDELTVGGNNLSTTVTGRIVDGGFGGGAGGSLVKTGTGTLTLSGFNTYTGATTVNAGTLAVNGSITPSSGVTVNSGGALGGTGTVGNTTIASGGALAPGNSIGTLTVSGNLAFSSGGIYAVEVSPTAADRTNVTGTATLTGATVQAIALPGSFHTQTYTILNATGGFGGTQFAGITGSSFAPGARNPHLTYNTNNVFLVLDPGTIQLPAGTGGNQSAVAGGINNAVLNGATPPAGFDALLNMTGAQLTNALAQVSGQPGGSTAQTGFAATGQFVNGVFDGAFGDGPGQGGALGFAQDDDEANAYAAKRQVSREAKDAYAAVTPRDRRAPAFEQRWAVWASVYGGNSRVNGDSTAGTNTTTSRIFGTAVGATYRFTPDTQAGFALGGAGSSFDIAGGFGGGKADIFNAAIYARHNWGAAYVAGLLGYSWQDTTTDRTVTISGTDRLHASFKAQALAARFEGGWRYATPVVGITPYAALQTTTFYLPSYGETATSGSNTFALNYASKTATATRSELGAKLDRAMPVRDGVFTVKAKTAWAHDWNTDRSTTATFQTLPGSTFTTNGAQPSANAALLSLGSEMKWHNGWSLAANVDGEFSRTTAGYAGKGSVKYVW